ncbi:hypothetical protein HJFPF1_09034 [Paramyrothecium foliicola]|nr:hypothetical protein HJFPF1_09034 [Paramyrothecium foliicola]
MRVEDGVRAAADQPQPIVLGADSGSVIDFERIARLRGRARGPVTASPFSVVISGMRVRSTQRTAFIPPKCQQRLIQTMVALSDINTVTSQFMYQEWGLELPTLQELAAPFQPIVEMLCSVESFCHSQTLVELAVTESSSPGFWLSQASIATLLHAGLIESHQNFFSGLLSRFRLWGPWPLTEGAASVIEAETAAAEAATRQEIDFGSTSLQERQNIASVNVNRPQAQPLWQEVVYSDPQCDDTDMAMVDLRRTPGPPYSGLPDEPGGYACLPPSSVESVEESMKNLTIANNPGLIDFHGECGSENADAGHPTKLPEVDEGSDEEMDADYWQWDSQNHQYRHWNEKDRAWVYSPEVFH